VKGHNDERISVVYFENQRGYIIVAPDTSHPTPQGYIRRECHTLREIDLLTRRLNLQDKSMFDNLMEKDRRIMQDKRDSIRSRLRQRMLAADCTNFERRFIRGAFEYLERKEKENTEFQIRGYFTQREFDAKKAGTEDYGKQLVMPRMSDRLAHALGVSLQK
jgi:hypothetical protein